MKAALCRVSSLIAVLLLAACTPGEVLAPRHMETGVNSDFRYEGIPFPAYTEHARKIILKYRRDITPDNRDKILEANSPFELLPGPACPKDASGKSERGILLIHGLSDSPFTMRDMAAHFQSRCFLVRAILLPGHGTVPGDLLNVTYDAWVAAARYGVRGLHEVAAKVYVAGFSTGGALAVHEAMAGESIDGLVLFSPAIALRTKLGFMANWHKPVSWAKTELKWLDLADDRDYAKYESFPMNAADQIYLLTEKLGRMKRHGGPVTLPIFMAASVDDATVDTQGALEFVLSGPNPSTRVVLYGNTRPPEAADPRMDVVKSAYVPMNIREFSHLSITLSPANPHYGIQGDYANCLHYLSEPASLEQCRSQGGLPYGELTEANKNAGLFRRLTFNPFFEDLTNRIDRFFQSID